MKTLILLLFMITCCPFSHAQITSVSQVKDVKTTDDCYEAVRNLVERWGLDITDLPGKPDSFFAGKPLTRLSFAMQMGPALSRTMELLEAAAADKSKDETAKMKQQFIKSRMKGYHDAAVIKITRVKQYKDIKSSDYYVERIQGLVEMYTLVLGSKGNLFSPQKKMTYDELKKIFSTYSNIVGSDIIPSSPKTITRGAWAIMLDKILNFYQDDIAELAAGAE